MRYPFLIVAGAYTISVKAQNPLPGAPTVTLAKPFYVQEAPYVVEYTNYNHLERDEPRFIYETPLGEVTEIIVAVDKGTDVKYDYDMGDGTQYTDKGNTELTV